MRKNCLLILASAVFLAAISCKTSEPEEFVIPGEESDYTPSSTSTIWGLVSCQGTGVPGVCVSDGVEVVRTNDQGYYEMASRKKNGYVFVSVPGGYTVKTNGVLPSFFLKTGKNADQVEKLNFNLVRDPGQEEYTMLYFGDMHLSTILTNSSREQFKTFTSEINGFLQKNPGKKVYAVTLGDMVWDCYWYAYGNYWTDYSFKEYLDDVNDIKGLAIFHCPGNHDHDLNATGDWATIGPYRSSLGPNYYSFNIGSVHYVVLDAIECTNSKPTKEVVHGDYRSYNEKVVSDDIDWLRKDLSFVDKSTPVVAIMHAGMFNQAGDITLENGSELLSCFDGFGDVTFVTGHTHILRTWRQGNVLEYNSASVCGCWWYDGHYHRTMNYCTDGTPGGYRVMSVQGKKQTSYYKGTGFPAELQFRTYDRNSIRIDPADYVSDAAKQANFAKSLKQYGDYGTASSADSVLINVWDYNTNWKISVKENGKELPCKRLYTADPIHFIAHNAMRYKDGVDPVTTPFKTTHIFGVKASGPDTTLEITVTDDEGRTYTETMKRPKPFNFETYQ